MRFMVVKNLKEIHVPNIRVKEILLQRNEDVYDKIIVDNDEEEEFEIED